MENDTADNFENKIYFNKYKPEKKIGEGSFGKIYSCTSINNYRRQYKHKRKICNKNGF